MGATGTASITFGAFPGADQASVAVTGQSGILSTSRVEAWIDPTQGGTSDHSVGEHATAPLDVRCEAVVAGTGFTITVTVRDQGVVAQLAYGAWSIAWVWV